VLVVEVVAAQEVMLLVIHLAIQMVHQNQLIKAVEAEVLLLVDQQ